MDELSEHCSRNNGNNAIHRRIKSLNCNPFKSSIYSPHKQIPAYSPQFRNYKYLGRESVDKCSDGEEVIPTELNWEVGNLGYK